MSDLFPESFSAELGDVSLELDRIGNLADGVARSLSQAFRGAIIDGKSLNNVLGDVASAFADIALKAALKPLAISFRDLSRTSLPQRIRRWEG